jgi:hypothetical protein
MSDISLEQALYGSRDAGGYRFLARSPGFREEWLGPAQRLCAGFGERPADVACPAAVFAQPLDADRVAVVQVADQGTDDAGRPGALAFRLLVLSHEAYEFLGGDPFALAERLPPPWQASGELPALSLPAEAPPGRTLAQVQNVLERYRDHQPTLLGSVQALVDGGRVVFVRDEPDAGLVRALWTLLPTSSRCRLWPASFAFGNALGFDALVVPQVGGVEYTGYVHESQAGDYPEGQYELNLQVAAESGDQAALDALFARRGHRDVWRIGLALLGAIALLAVAFSVLGPNDTPAPAPPAAPAPADRPQLAPPEEYPALDEARRRQLTPALQALAERLGVPEPRPADVEGLIDALDAHLGTPDPKRDPGPLAPQGPAGRRLRLLLWKHGVPEYNDARLNPAELVERFERRLTENRTKKTEEKGP